MTSGEETSERNPLRELCSGVDHLLQAPGEMGSLGIGGKVGDGWEDRKAVGFGRPEVKTSTPVLQNVVSSPSQLNKTGFGQVVGDGGPPHSSTNAPCPREDDLAALKKECAYLENTVRNINAQLEQAGIDPEARRIIAKTKQSLASMCTEQEFRSSVPSHRLRVASGDSTDDERLLGGASKRHARKDRPASIRGSESTIHELLARLDNRSAPRPEPFDPESGQRFDAFTALFEEYCSCNFRGSSVLWLGELGSLLTGDVKRAFEALKAPGDDYFSVRGKLATWVNSRQEKMRLDIKHRFSSANMEMGESCSVFAARLEKLFRLAYPDRDIEASSTLRRKYLESVPSDLYGQLQTAINITKGLTSREITWANLLLHTCQYETAIRRDSSVVPPEPPVRATPCSHQVASCCHQCGCSWEAYHASPVAKRSSHSAGDRTYSQAWARPGGKPVRHCDYCSKDGHLRSECRKMNGRCFLCGAGDHRIAQCPQRRTASRETAREIPNLMDCPATANEPAREGTTMEESRSGGGRDMGRVSGNGRML